MTFFTRYFSPAHARQHPDADRPGLRLATAGALLFALCAPAWAEGDALLPIEHWQQPDGAQVWLITSPGLPMLDLRMDFDAGSRRDPSAQAGLASATAGLLTSGTRATGGRPALDEDQISDAWADLGASFSASASNDRFTVRLRSLTEGPLLQQAVELAEQQLGHPAWPAAVWQRERQRWEAGLLEAHTRPAYIANQAFERAVYGSHPYGYQITPQSLQRIDTADMRSFYSSHVLPCRARVSIVGDIDRVQAEQLVTRLLADLPRQAQCPALPAVAEVQPLTKAEQIDIPFRSEQAQVLTGQPGIRRDDPDFFTYLVADHILGGSGFGSRLMEEVREKRGLVYGVSSSFAPGDNAGAIVIALQTRADQAAQASELVHEVVKKFVTDGPSETELQQAKANMIGGFALRLDSNAKLLGNLANIAWNDLPLDYLDTWREKINAVTVADVRRVTQRVLKPDDMVTVIVGGQDA